MTDKADEISSCLKYLEKYVEDDDNVEIIFFQEEDEHEREAVSGGLYNMNKMEAVKAITFQDSTISTPPVRFQADSENPKVTQKVTNDGLIAEDVEEIPNFTGNSKNDALEDDAQTTLPKFQCFVCSFNCTRKCDLTKHLEKHFNPRDCLFCKVCKKQFPTKKRLNKHINLLADIRSYQCEKCNKTFNSKCSLGRHWKQTHSGMKPYKCTKCDYETFLRPRLKYHIAVHAEDRPFKCLSCSYASKVKTNLMTHLKIHTDDKPYKCDKCNFRFARAASLRNHLQRHFKEHDKTHHTPYKCDKCNFRFVRASYLRKHLQRHFKEHDKTHQ